MSYISQDVHKAVVVVTKKDSEIGDAITFGFTTIADAIYFVEGQVTEEAEKKAAIVDALDEGYILDDIIFRVYDVESYLDIYEENED